MVLDISSSSPGDAFPSDAPPANAPDSWDGDSSPDRSPYSYQINYKTLPKPLPIVGPLAGFNEKFIGNLTAHKLSTAAQVLKRRPSDDEAQAYAFHSAKSARIASYYVPVGIGSGLYRAYTTSNTYRFPFFRPNLEKFSPDVFPHPTMAFVKGPTAKMFWHVTRGLLYTANGLFVSSVFILSYAATVATVGEMADPRLKEVSKAIRERAQSQRSNLGKQRPSPGQLTGAESPYTVPTNKNNPIQPDDASPTAGFYKDVDVPAETNTGEISDTQRSPQAEGGARNWPRRVPSESQPKTAEERAATFDSASQARGQRIGDDIQPGSAWDRVRSNASSGAGRNNEYSWPTQEGGQAAAGRSSWKGRRGGDSESKDSFSISQTEREKNFAKEEAQREFDERVERERRGGDFSKADGDQKRW